MVDLTFSDFQVVKFLCLVWSLHADRVSSVTFPKYRYDFISISIATIRWNKIDLILRTQIL